MCFSCNDTEGWEEEEEEERMDEAKLACRLDGELNHTNQPTHNWKEKRMSNYPTASTSSIPTT